MSTSSPNESSPYARPSSEAYANKATDALYDRVEKAFHSTDVRRAVENPISDKRRAEICGIVRAQLDEFRVQYEVNPKTMRSFSTGRTTCICASNNDVKLIKDVAGYTERTRRLWMDERDVTIVLALSPRDKCVRFGDNETKMEDVNSGVTLPRERLIILFRWEDYDFWKVLQHELIHLCRGTKNEAETEANALVVHTMIVADDRADFRRRMAVQMKVSADNERLLSGANVGTTNAWRYWVLGYDMIKRFPEVLAGTYEPHITQPNAPPGTQRGSQPLHVSAFGNASGLPLEL